MPAPATVSDFLDVCRKSGVVDESSLSTIAGPNTNSPMAAAKALIRSGALTKFQAGQLLAGKYKGLRFDRLKILDKIGAGGMGTVFLCEHLGLRKQVAVKVLPPDQAGDEGVRERFFREARAAASLDHPNIVRVHDMNSSGGVHYIVMEYVEGQDLQSLLNKYGPLPFGRACNYIAQAALGLQHAHEKGLVHRDIKPANLLVDKEGVVKILDLGLATFSKEKENENDNLTARFDKGAVLGTADYMAPEQILESSNVDIRADIYSLGVTLYALINGKPPFGGSCTQKLMGHTTVIATSLTAIRREVPKALSAVVDKMMAKAPDQRLQTPAEVIEALNPWLEADTIPLDAQQTRKMPGTAKSLRGLRLGKKRSKAPVIIAAVVLSALLFGGLGAWALTGDDGHDKVQGTEIAAGQGRNQPQNKQAAPKAKANNPAPAPANNNAPPITPVAAREEARLIYEIDFSKVPAFLAKYDNKKRIAMDGSFPAGWTGQSWRADSVADVGIKDHEGSRGIAMITRSGEGGSAEIHTPTTGAPWNLVPGRRYVLRTDYANVGTQTGSFEVRFDAERPPTKNNSQLKPTRGEWQTVDLKFTAPKHEKFAIYYTHGRGVFPDYIVVRSLQVFEIAEEAAAPPPSGRVVLEEDFSRSAPFRGTMAKPGGLVLQEGRLPDGWNTYVWKQGASGDIALEEFAGRRGVALRTTDGEASAEFTTTSGGSARVKVKAGRRYRVDVEYGAPGPSGGRIDVRLDDLAKPGANQTRLNPTGLGWQTGAVEFSVPPDKDRPFALFVSNYGVGQKNSLFVRTVKLYELADGAAAGPAPPAGGYTLSLVNAKPFAQRIRKEGVLESQGEGTLPNPWAARTQGDTVADVFVDPVGGQPALGLRNHEGTPSAELYCKSSLLTAKAGKKYAVRVTYQTEANGKGGIQVSLNGLEAGRADFVPSVGAWKDLELTVTATGGGPLTLTITCGSVGSEASIFIKSIEIRES
jgi:eukaryotic-like serine/threonine-protein kinase